MVRKTLLVLLSFMSFFTAGCSGATAYSSLGPNSPATEVSKTILFEINNREGLAVFPGCRLVRSGDIGPLRAPYKECPVVTKSGEYVNYVPLNSPIGYELSYTTHASLDFEDHCVQHLTGNWWASQRSNLLDPAAPCPSGWHFNSAP